MTHLARMCAFAAVLAAVGSWARAEETAPAPAPAALDCANGEVTQGALRFRNADGRFIECPLKNTAVWVEIAGFVARVRVVQTFENPATDKIEAVYVFPLPHGAAVDGMTMQIGDRRIVGLIGKRAEARKVYEQALAKGQTAALLEQERPNVFTQAVGNIPPGGTVKVEISYVDVLDYDKGVYTFHFPMVVGHRYMPGSPVPGRSGTGYHPDTDRVPDASRLTPQRLPPGSERSGHDISLVLRLDAGVPVRDIRSTNHEVRLNQTGLTTATCSILPADSIPNKDFELRYKVIGGKPELAVLDHAITGDDGYFMLMVQPREDDALRRAPPREITFLIDASGSMQDEPEAQAKRVMNAFLESARPDDLIQMITFRDQETKLFPQPVECTAANVKTASDFVASYRSDGGTEMLKGVKEALAGEPDGYRVRIVIMLTDGGVGNEDEILKEVKTRCGDGIRFWCIGVGNSVNRHLVDGVARNGGGMSKVLSLNGKPEEVKELVTEVVERIHRAQLADISVNWGELDVYGTQPERLSELWAGRPVVLFGRYRNGGKGRILVSGQAEGQPVSFGLDVELAREQSDNDALASVWARKKIESLTDRILTSDAPGKLVEEITDLALKHRLMTAYTSFVAVDEQKLSEEARAALKMPRQVGVPVAVPDGVSPEVFEYAGSSLEDIPLGGTGVTGSIGVGGGGMSGTFGYRNGGGRRNAVGRFGGSAGTESANEAALAWLARHQDAGGFWDAKAYGATDDCRGEATGLAVLAFLGAGHTTAQGRYADNVSRAVKQIVAWQEQDGSFKVPDAEGYRAHAILTLALTEAYGMTNDAALRKAAQRAVDRAAALQDKSGGWPSRSGAAVDAVTTGWFVMVFKSAKIAGLRVDGSAFQGAARRLDGIVPRRTSTAELASAMTGRLFMGAPNTDRQAVQAAEGLLAKLPEWSKAKAEGLSYEYWYLGSLAMFQQGGEHWKKWNEALKNVLINNQDRIGPPNGSPEDRINSWEPQSTADARGGRVVATALATLTLEVYYRYLPLYAK